MAPQVYDTTYTYEPTQRGVKRDTNNVLDIVKDFLDLYSSTDYDHINATNAQLEAAMRAEMKGRNIRSPLLEQTLHIAASLIELAFYGCTFEEKKNIALYNWFIIYIDDAVLSDPLPFVSFQYRFMKALPQLDPVLDAFSDVLHAICASYPPLQSNLILSSTFEFVSVTCVEPQLSLTGSQTASKISGSPTKNATRFPLFLRERTGLGLPGALMLFSPTQPVEFVDCFRALGDMTFWTAAVNDLLSFFKEQLAGETATYIHTRASAEGRSPVEVLSALTDELCAASRNITQALSADPVAAETWRMFEYGVVAWHLENDRYRLRELDDQLVRHS